jgi:hypothetical protein
MIILKPSVVAVAVAAASMLALSTVALAAPEELFKARLSTVPIDSSMRALVTGYGEATARLENNRLTITGTFGGLQRPANLARLHIGPVMGVGGEPIQDIEVENSVSGHLGGSVDLTADQRQALDEGRMYIQIHSESAPEGNLRGWLLK